MQQEDRNEHFCCIKPTTAKTIPESGKMKYVFFDIESKINPETREHLPFLICAIDCCPRCISNFDLTKPTECCGERRYEFLGDDSSELFVDWLYFTRKCQKTIAIAHNGGKYDHVFIIRELIRRQLMPILLNRGMKILQAEAQRVVLKDSLNFVQAPLAAFPHMFGLDEEDEKSFFPYFFLSDATIDYKG